MAGPASAPSIESLTSQDQIAMLQEENAQLWKTIEMMQNDFASLAKRVKNLEGMPKESKKAESHLDVLYDYLIKSGQKGLTYKQMATILKVTPRRAKQLKTHITEDDRFIVVRHPTRTNSHVICLRKVIK
jgi:Zn-dependent M32 family carboxypeptidase